MTFTKIEKTSVEKITKSLLAPAALTLFCLACSLFGGGSPTAVYKAFLAAAKKKDTAAMKEYLSEDSISMLKSAAKSGGKSEDELLSSFSENNDESAEISNEKIAAEGKSASIDVKNKSDKTTTIYFVKEGSWKINPDKPKEKSEETVKTTPTDSPDSLEPKDTSPVTISASGLIDEAKSSSSGMEKYRGRMMTVTGAELWEIQYSMLHIGAKYGSYSSGYIICSGSFSEYMPYSSKISDLKRQGKSPGATIKGTFSKVVMDAGYTQVHLDPCVLSDLEKP